MNDQPHEGGLKRQAEDRVLQLERAERAGELSTLRDVLAERRATIARLQEEELALRKRVLELEADVTVNPAGSQSGSVSDPEKA